MRRSGIIRARLRTFAPVFGAAGVLLSCVTAPADAQDTTRAPAPRAMDTVEVRDSSLMGGAPPMSRSPLRATLYSFVPGLGQIYNEQYLKAALLFGAGSFFAAQAVYFHNRFLQKAREVDAIPADSVSARAQPRADREFYRDNRDQNVAYFVGVQILSMIDAYVGANLFDFDVEGGQVMGLVVDPARNTVGLAVRF